MKNFKKLQLEVKLLQDRKYLASFQLTALHHVARARGYWPTTKDNYLECYSGKYGHGFIRRRASRYSQPLSNRYHSIEYWIYSAK